MGMGHVPKILEKKPVRYSKNVLRKYNAFIAITV
jgi:hypothetical protein